MTTKHQISCITKSANREAHDQIVQIGGVSGSSRWTLSLARAIQGIETQELEFYVRSGTQVVPVIVASKNGTKYLKTEFDKEQPDNLLSLPACPQEIRE